MAFRVLECGEQSELVCVKLFKAWVDFKYYIKNIRVQYTCSKFFFAFLKYGSE